jgi:hypothetical protein
MKHLIRKADARVITKPNWHDVSPSLENPPTEGIDIARKHTCLLMMVYTQCSCDHSYDCWAHGTTAGEVSLLGQA